MKIHKVSPGVGNGNPFQYSCLENSKDRGGLRPMVHRVAKSTYGITKMEKQITSKILKIT